MNVRLHFADVNLPLAFAGGFVAALAAIAVAVATGLDPMAVFIGSGIGWAVGSAVGYVADKGPGKNEGEGGGR